MDESDLKGAWRAQPQPKVGIDAADLTARASAFATTIARRNRVEYAAGGLAIAAFVLYAFVFDAPLIRLGSVLTVLGMALVLFELHRRGSATAPSARDLGQPCLEFHRAELVRQRAALASAWAWYVLPLVPGLVVFGAGLAGTSEVARQATEWVGALVVAIFAAIVWVNRRAATRLQHEIDRLDNLR